MPRPSQRQRKGSASRPQARGARAQSSGVRERKKQKNPLRWDWWLLILVAVAHILFFFKFCWGYVRKSRYGLICAAVVLLAAISASVVVGVNLARRPNALEVFLDNQSVGIIRTTRQTEITPEHLKYMAQVILENRHDMSVSILSEVTATPLRFSDSEILVIPDTIVSALVNGLRYHVLAAVITVDGTEMAVLTDADAAQSILDTIKQRYLQEDLNIVRQEFIEDVRIIERYVYSRELTTASDALAILTTPLRQADTYTVQPGDVSGVIAMRFGMSLSTLVQLNPGLNPDVLQPNQVLVITRPIPVVSVRTFERVVFYEVIPMQTQTTSTNHIPAGHTRVLQQGRDGQRRVTADIIRIDGMEFEREIIGIETIVEPIVQRIEVGS